MSSSVNYDPGHSGDAALTSHQDKKPPLIKNKNYVDDDNNSSTQDDIKQSHVNAKIDDDGDDEIYFGDFADDTFSLDSLSTDKPKGTSKVSLSPQKETTLALSPSSSDAQPLQPTTKHNVKPSSSSSSSSQLGNKYDSLVADMQKNNVQQLLDENNKENVQQDASLPTKPSSQQLDTSSQSNDDVDFNNTKQPPSVEAAPTAAATTSSSSATAQLDTVLSNQLNGRGRGSTTKQSSQKPDTSPEYTIYSMVEELQLPEQGTVQHSPWEDMIGFATKEKSELDPLELHMQPEIHRILDLRNGKITLKQYEKEHKQWRIDLKTLIDCGGKYTANLGITALFICDGVIIAYYATLNEILYICPHEEVDINKVDTNNPSMRSILKDIPQAIIKETSGRWLPNFSVKSHGIKVIDCIPVCCELRKEEATVVELANDISTTPSKVKSVSAVLLSAAANYKLVKTEEALDILFASKGAQEQLRFGCSSKQAKERSIIHKPSRNKLLNDHGWMVHGENLIGRLAKIYLRNPIYTPALHKQIGVSIMNFLHAAWRHRPELLALIKPLKCTTFLLKKAGHLNLSPEEMEAAAETIRISIKKFVDNAAQARSAVATLKNDLGTDFDMEEALTFLGDEGCKPGVLSKLEFEHDCRYARAKYVTDSAAGRDMVKIFAEIENEFGTNVLDWLKSGVGQSMAKAEFDRLSIENVDMTDDDIIDKMRKMTVKGSKVKLFSDCTIRHLKSTVVERSKTRDEYNRLLADDMKPDDALAKLKASDKFSAGSISHLESSNKKSLAYVELNKLKKSGMSSKDGIAKLKKSGKLSADDKWLECNDKKGQAWAIHRKLKKQKSLEEIRDEIRDNRDLGAKYANLVYNLMTSVENKISRETAGMRRHVNEVETALENGKTILVAIHNPVGCKGECLVIWDGKSRHKQKNAAYNTKVGDIKFVDKINCGCCRTVDRDFTLKSAVTNESYETIFFDKESNSNIVKLTSVADLTSWSKEKERTIRERHESEVSTADEEVADDSTASAAAAKQPPAKKEKATKSKSASSKKTQSKSKRKPSEEKEEKKKKKKLKKLDSSKDSKMAAPTKKKDISKKAVPKKKSTKSKPIVGSSSKAASKLASKSSKSANNGSSNKKEKEIDIGVDRRFFIVKKVNNDDLATVQAELDRLIKEFREQLGRETIVKEFIDMYRNEWRQDMFETLRNWLQTLATSDSDSDDD